MTISEDMEILKSVALVRQANAQCKFFNSRRLHCPVCGDDCPVLEDVLSRRMILYCRACQSDFLIQIREHISLIDIHQKEEEQ